MVHEWNGQVESFSRPQVTENCYRKESFTSLRASSPGALVAGWEKEGELATTRVMNGPLKFLRVDVCKYRPEIGKNEIFGKIPKKLCRLP